MTILILCPQGWLLSYLVQHCQLHTHRIHPCISKHYNNIIIIELVGHREWSWVLTNDAVIINFTIYTTFLTCMESVHLPTTVEYNTAQNIGTFEVNYGHNWPSYLSHHP